MNPTSRPLRALGVILGGWTMMRVVALWLGGSAAELPLAETASVPPAPLVAASPFDPGERLFPERRLVTVPSNNPDSGRPEFVSGSIAKPGPAARAEEWMRDQAQNDGNHDHSAAPKPSAPSFALSTQTVASGLPLAMPRNHFSGSAWALMRSDGRPSLASGGQLGGSQIGVRVFYTPGPAAMAITARISAPLAQPTGREAAIGLALRGRNVGIIAEQRIALDKGGHHALSVFAYGGFYDVKLAGGLKLDGYAQAGVVGVKSPAAFVDGAVRIERAVVKSEKASLAVGAGAWGGAQPGLSRIDVGPQIVARIAVAETNLRVSAEWRQRVAGHAAPATGPSVTVGFDF